MYAHYYLGKLHIRQNAVRHIPSSGTALKPVVTFQNAYLYCMSPDACGVAPPAPLGCSRLLLACHLQTLQLLDVPNLSGYQPALQGG